MRKGSLLAVLEWTRVPDGMFGMSSPRRWESGETPEAQTDFPSISPLVPAKTVSLGTYKGRAFYPAIFFRWSFSRRETLVYGVQKYSVPLSDLIRSMHA